MADMPKKRGSTVATSDLSRHFLATLAQWTGGLSPQAFGGAWLNVLTRLAVAPGRQVNVIGRAIASDRIGSIRVCARLDDVSRHRSPAF